MSNITNFIANSDFPFDMVAYYATATMTTNSDLTQEMTFSHNLPFTPLCFGLWSDTEDFSGTVASFLDGNTTGFLQFILKSYGDRIYIKRNGEAPSNKKYYFKIYGFAPTTWTGECEPTATSNNSLLLNTDMNYAPLVVAGRIEPYNMSAPRENTNYNYTIKDSYILVPPDARQASMAFRFPDYTKPKVLAWYEDAQTGETYLRNTVGYRSNGYPSGYIATYTPSPNNMLTVTINSGTRLGTAPLFATHVRIYA